MCLNKSSVHTTSFKKILFPASQTNVRIQQKPHRENKPAVCENVEGALEISDQAALF